MQTLLSKPLITPANIQPSRPDFEVAGVFNPGAVKTGDEVILLLRVAETAKEKRDGLVASPQLISKPGEPPEYTIDWYPADSRNRDPRKFYTPNCHMRLTTISHLEIARLDSNNLTVKSIEKHPQLFGQGETENFGIEDPRITQIDDTFYITYVAVSSVTGVTTALMSTKDFHTFTRLGTIFPCENKDVVLFPEKINGNYWAYHRPVPHQLFNDMAIESAQSPDLRHWGQYAHVLSQSNKTSWDASRIGAGTPPIKTPHGWLTFIHQVNKQADEPIGQYEVGVMLTALDNTSHVLARSHEPLLTASQIAIANSFVPNVVFPTGVIRDDDTLHLFCGVNDIQIAAVDLSLDHVIASTEAYRK